MGEDDLLFLNLKGVALEDLIADLQVFFARIYLSRANCQH